MRTAMLAAMQEASVDGILVVDPDRKILSYNSRFVEMWGLKPSVLALGSDLTAIRSVLDKLADPEGFTRRVEALYSDSQAKTFDELELKDGRTFERYSSPVVSTAGRYYGRIWYFRDITRRKRAEADLQRKTDALRRSNADLEAYAYTAAHDLKAPLAKIEAFSQILASSSPLTDRQRDLAVRISKGAERMKTLLGDVLTLSRVAGAAAPVEDVDAGKVMAEVLSDLEAQIKQSGATVEVGPLPRLRAHATFVRILLQNLVGNAIKFRREGVPPKVCVESRMAADGAEITVSDNGVGFDPKDAKRIFEPFTRLHAGYEGSGIGLPACESIAERYGGRIDATSVPGRGSTFRVWLPRSALAEAR